MKKSTVVQLNKKYIQNLIMVVSLSTIINTLQGQNTFPSTGNVGIGTTTPHAPLHFSNTVSNRKIVLFQLAALNNDHQYYGFGVNDYIFRYQTDTENADHVFYAAKNATTSTELMRIKGTGRVGIGTGTPLGKLHIINSNQAADGSTLILGPTDQSNLRLGYHQDYSWIQSHGGRPLSINPIGSNNDVGIGTIAPLKKLHVKGTGIRMEQNSGVIIDISQAAAQNEAWIGTISNHSLLLGTNNTPEVQIETDGTVKIGSLSTNIDSLKKVDFRLFVDKGVVASDFAITTPDTWADFVFTDGYKLRSLQEVNSFIRANKHLPDMPSEKVVKEEGYTVHDMTTKLLQKVEELTLYAIDQDKKIREQDAQINVLTSQLADIKALLQIKK